MNYLLDTCVLSEYIKTQPAPQVIAWLDEQDEDRLFICAISIGEITKGIVKLQAGNPARAKQLTVWQNRLEQRFMSRTLALDSAVMRVWGERYGEAEKEGKVLPLMDSLVMACAANHNLTIVTRNIKDFAGFPHVFNPWETAV